MGGVSNGSRVAGKERPVSAEQNKATVLRHFVVSHNPPFDLDVIGETCTPESAEQQKAWHRMERDAFPDKRFTVEDAIAEGDKVVLRWTVRGTHRGPFWTPVGTIPATGKSVTVEATVTYRLEGGRIAEEWISLDWLDAVQQLGAEVRPPSPN